MRANPTCQARAPRTRVIQLHCNCNDAIHPSASQGQIAYNAIDYHKPQNSCPAMHLTLLCRLWVPSPPLRPSPLGTVGTPMQVSRPTTPSRPWLSHLPFLIPGRCDSEYSVKCHLAWGMAAECCWDALHPFPTRFSCTQDAMHGCKRRSIGKDPPSALLRCAGTLHRGLSSCHSI